MAEVFQYKTSQGGSWADVTAAAWPEMEGSLFLEWPPATELDGEGKPAAAFGRPRIVIRSPQMTGTGMEFWQGLFASDSAESADIWLTVYNPRDPGWEKWKGVLHRPKFSDLAPGAGTGNTVYRNVEIVVTECETTT